MQEGYDWWDVQHARRRLENVKGRDHLGDTGVNGRIINSLRKLILKENVVRV
jgi:hypothetical protein